MNSIIKQLYFFGNSLANRPMLIFLSRGFFFVVFLFTIIFINLTQLENALEIFSTGFCPHVCLGTRKAAVFLTFFPWFIEWGRLMENLNLVGTH